MDCKYDKDWGRLVERRQIGERLFCNGYDWGKGEVMGIEWFGKGK